jgi:hypothetical protein
MRDHVSSVNVADFPRDLPHVLHGAGTTESRKNPKVVDQYFADELCPIDHLLDALLA